MRASLFLALVLVLVPRLDAAVDGRSDSTSSPVVLIEVDGLILVVANEAGAVALVVEDLRVTELLPDPALRIRKTHVRLFGLTSRTHVGPLLLLAAEARWACGSDGAEHAVVFTYREMDDESGLQYTRARHYAPSLGRFIQRDPVLGNVPREHYIYASNRPTSVTDPTGLFTQEDYKRLRLYALSFNDDTAKYAQWILAGDAERRRRDNGEKTVKKTDTGEVEYSSADWAKEIAYNVDQLAKVTGYKVDPQKDEDLSVFDGTVFAVSNVTKWKVRVQQGQETVTADSVQPVYTNGNPIVGFGTEDGPTPPGEYLIGTRYEHQKYGCDWHKLYPRKEDGSGYYRYDQATQLGRSTMGFHPGQVSHGCVTVRTATKVVAEYNDDPTWQGVRALLDKGKYTYNKSEYRGILWVEQ